MAFHLYNTFRYNTSQYNADAFTWVQRLTETLTSSDATIPNSYKALAETLSLVDARAMNSMRAFTDLMLLTDFVSKSILNKGMSERVRINDWVQIKRLTNSPNWSN